MRIASNRSSRASSVSVRHVAVRLAHRLRDSWSAGALLIAARGGWQAAYIACALFAVPAMIVGLAGREPSRAPRHLDARSASSRGWTSARIGPTGCATPVRGSSARRVSLIEFFRAAARCWCCCSSCCTRSATRWPNLTFQAAVQQTSGYTNDEIAAVRRRLRLLGVSRRHLHRRHAVHAQLGMKRSCCGACVLMASPT